jgi:phosphoglycerate dehydrogenase-like enzyme
VSHIEHHTQHRGLPLESSDVVGAGTSRVARVWLGLEQPSEIVAAMRRGGAIPSSIEAANVVIWSGLDHDVSRMRGLLHPGIEWVQVDSAGVDHWVASGLVSPARLWTSARGRYGAAVAEQAVALLLACCRKLPQQARARRWTRVEGQRLEGKTVGIIGAGAVGRETIARLEPFGVRILVLDERDVDVPGAERSYAAAQLHQMLAECDHAVVAVPLTPSTRGMIGRRELELIRPGGLLVNVGRGAVVDTDALAAALACGQLGGAGLDVTEPEPLPDDHPLWHLDNVLITSHSANSREMLRAAYAGLVEENLQRFRRGEEPLGVIDVALGY